MFSKCFIMLGVELLTMQCLRPWLDQPYIPGSSQDHSCASKCHTRETGNRQGWSLHFPGLTLGSKHALSIPPLLNGSHSVSASSVSITPKSSNCCKSLTFRVVSSSVEDKVPGPLNGYIGKRVWVSATCPNTVVLWWDDKIHPSLQLTQHNSIGL